MARRRLRRSVATVVAVGTLLLVAACGSTPSTSDPANSGGGDAQEASAALDPACPVGALDRLTVPIAITVWAPFTGSARDALDQVVTRYNASHPMVHVSVATMPADPSAQRAAYRQARDSAALPAVVAVDSTVTQFMIDSGTVSSASACRRAAGSGTDTALPVVTNASAINTTDWASSTSPSTEVLVYRRDLFTRAGLDPDTPPRTLEEVEAQARKLKAAGATTPPVVLPVDAFLVENWLNGAGVALVDHSNGHEKHASKAMFDNPRTLMLYQWIQRMLADGLLSMSAPADGQPAETPEATLTHAAMTVAPSSSIAAVAAATAVTMPELDAAPMPGLDAAGRGQISGITWFPTNAGPDTTRAAAWDFLTFLNTVPNQVAMNVTGSYLPNNTHAPEDPALDKMWTTTRRGPWFDTAYTQLTNLDPSAPGPLIGPYDATRAAIHASLAAIVAGHPAPEAILNANTAIDAALATYQPDHP